MIDVTAVYERHAPEIHDFLARTVHDHAVAEDLTQNTFIRLMERGDSVREEAKLRPWLFTVAHNLAVTHVTRRTPADPIEAAFAIASGEKGPEEEAVAADAARLVWDAARSLEPRQYAVLDLTVRRGFSVGEIAEVLEITPAHAAVVVHRAREALAQAIRLLVVVRQRRHCARLAELIPAGTEVLTPDLRATADRHMRRCEVCKEVGAKLTDPAELLAVLPLLPLPLALHHAPLFAAPAAAAAGHTAATTSAATITRVSAPLRTVGLKTQHFAHPVALAGLAALAIAGASLGISNALHSGSQPSAVAPRHTVSAQAGGGAGSQAVPPITGGPSQPVAEVPPAELALNHDIDVYTAPPPTDNPVPTPAAPSPAPSPSPSPPAAAPLIDIHEHVPPGTPLGNAGIDVVGEPPTVPVVIITPPGGASAAHQSKPAAPISIRHF